MGVRAALEGLLTNSIQQDWAGPDWPLGFIKVVTPGVPVRITSVVDPNNVNDPSSPSPGTPGSNEYTQRSQQIMFQAFKPGASHGTTYNTGNIYIVRRGCGGGGGNRDDMGSIVATLFPGTTILLGSAAKNLNVWNPYRYYIDADNANDGVFVTLIIQ